ncbi:macrolide family glycosyltransferase [Pseudonocardia endophytica]|nr:macrolide family glycosyltransferase [Pseudonocardia endophytica]
MGTHFAFVSMPAAGHVTPTLPLVTELVRRGHRVSYATGDDMLDTVRAAGAEPVPAPFRMPDVPPPAPGAPASDEPRAPRIDAFAESVEQTFPVLTERFAADPPAAVCGDAMSPVTSLVAQRLHLPFVSLNPSFASNEHFSLRRDVMARSPKASVFETAFRSVGERIAAFASTEGLRFDATEGFSCPGDLNLVFIPREFQPAGDTFDGSFVFCGPSVAGRTGADDAWRPRDPDTPVLLVSLGTVFNDRPEFFRTCAEAFADDDRQVVMAIGDRTDPDDLGPLPDNVEAHPHVPQVQVLAHAAGFVTHNGMNSTMEALYLGVPQIGVPQMPEQEANARRIEEIGCGRRLDPLTVDAASLRSTVDAVVGDVAVRNAVGAMSTRLRASNGAVTGADALEALVAA